LPDTSETATVRRDCRSECKPPGPGDRQHLTVRIVDVGGEPTRHREDPPVGAHGAVDLQDMIAAIDLEVLLFGRRSLEVPRSYDVDRMLVEPMPAQEDRVAAEKADRNAVLRGGGPCRRPGEEEREALDVECREPPHPQL